MRLVVPWLRDFVDITVSPDAIAGTLGLRGFEVAAVEGDVIDFEVTANRPDALSILGLAREVATAYDLPLRAPAPVSDADRGAIRPDAPRRASPRGARATRTGVAGRPPPGQ